MQSTRQKLETGDAEMQRWGLTFEFVDPEKSQMEGARQKKLEADSGKLQTYRYSIADEMKEVYSTIHHACLGCLMSVTYGNKYHELICVVELS